MIIPVWKKNKYTEEGIVRAFKRPITDSKVEKVHFPLATIPIEKKGKIRWYVPTKKQVLAMNYRLNGMSRKKAVLKAGYSPKYTGNRMAKRIDQLIEITMGDELKKRLEQRGLTLDKYADKFKEWLDAQATITTKSGETVVTPDYNTQIKAYDRIAEIVGINDKPIVGQGGIARKITMEEYTFGEDPENLK